MNSADAVDLALARAGGGEKSAPAVPQMRLLLDARKLHDGGIGTYLRNLLMGFRQRRGVSVSVLVRESEAADPLVQNLPHIITSSGLYSLHELFALGREIPWADFTLFHTPHFVLPFFVPVPSVVTIHDLNHLYHPERTYYPFFAAPYLISALTRARHIIAVSEQTRLDIRRFCRGSRRVMQKVSVVPNAVAIPPADAEPLASEGSYLLAVVSTDKPHKGVRDLLAAFGEVSAEFPQLQLVIVGKGAPRAEQLPRSLAERVTLVGCIDAEELWRQYRGARAVVVSSVQEGFCLPMIEAHAVGVPVVARPVPAVQALATEGDCIAADMSRGAFTAALREMILRPIPDREMLVGHAQRYAIPEVTAQTIACYREALS